MSKVSLENPATTEPGRRLYFRAMLAVVIFAAAACFSHIHQGSLKVDGIRYAHIAQNIVNTGEWFVLYDEFKDAEYNNKPPLLLWLVAGSIKIFGFSTFAAKLPSALFVFAGLLLLWDVAARYYSYRAAFFTLLLFCANRVFWRAIVDLNFEGMVLCGALLCLRTCLSIVRENKLGRGEQFIFGLGLFLLLQSKPPYVFFILAPMLALYVRAPQLRETLRQLVFSPVVVGSGLLGVSWLLLSSQADMGRMFSNQVSHPLTIIGSYFTNLLRWARTLLFEFAPFSWLGFWAVFIGVRKGALAPQSRRALEYFFLLAWIAPAVGVIFLVEHQSRYLIISFLALSLLAGKAAAALCLQTRSRHLMLGCQVVGTACFLAFCCLGVRAHGENGAVALLRRQAVPISESAVVCAGGEDNLTSKPGRKRVSMLLELEFQTKFAVVMYQTLGRTQLEPGASFLAENDCIGKLAQSGAQFTILESDGEYSAVRLDAALPEVTRSGADDRNFHDYF